MNLFEIMSDSPIVTVIIVYIVALCVVGCVECIAGRKK